METIGIIGIIMGIIGSILGLFWETSFCFKLAGLHRDGCRKLHYNHLVTDPKP